MKIEVSPVKSLNKDNPKLSASSQALLNKRLLRLERNSSISRRSGREPVRLSCAQERLWFLDQLKENSAVYNVPFGLRIKGELNASVLRRCLEEIVQRHEALRTHFETVDGCPVQVIDPCPSLQMPFVDLTFLPQEQREKEALRQCREDARLPFDLRRDLMLRVKLFGLGHADHILLLNVHHIASDEWSMGVLFHELTSLYAAFIAGKPSPLQELPVQYADFALWQRQRLQEEEMKKHLRYWKKRLEGAPAFLELPTDRPRPAIQSHRGATLRETLPRSLTSALTELSRATDATLFMTLLAAFQTLLHRYTGAEDILVGAPFAGRSHTEVERLIGFFVNTFVLRGDLSGNPTFRQLLARTRDTAFEAYEHQELPFDRLVQELHPERNTSHSPILQVLFVLQNAPWQAPSLPGMEVVLVPLDSGSSKFDLTFIVRPRNNELQTVVEYNTDLFDATTIERLMGHYQTLLEGIVSNPDQTLSGLPLLTQKEHKQIVVEWNRTGVDYPKNRSIHELVEAQAERTPQAVAVVFGGQEITYFELNARANQLAHYLRKLGVGADTRVGICIERSLDMIIGLLGILKAGGAYVPLDPEYPAERLAFMVEDTGPIMVLTQAKFAERLPRSASFLFLDVDRKRIAKFEKLNPTPVTNGESPAYVMYTSGSTGQPKGVAVPHRGVVRLVKGASYASFSPEEVFLHMAPLAFDASTFEIWGALLNGAKLAVMPPQQPSLQEIGAAIAHHGVTTLWLTSGLFDLMVGERLADLKPLRQLLAGGDVLSANRVQQVYENLEGCRLINGYGPTESTTFACCYTVGPHTSWNCPIPIGRPISNTQTYILDKWLNPVPVGIYGELYLGGDGLAQGYHNRAELTAERFIANPFVHDAGDRLYKTGDLARYLPDGNIEFLGRRDQQVKLRGFRIELGEIEAALKQHPQVEATAVVVREDLPGDKRLLAYVVGSKGDINHTELREFLRTKLPEYMVPSAFVTLEALPLTPNGKVDRKALPKPEFEFISGKFVPPATPTECALAEIWSEILGIKQIGAHDNYFELGGHSLQAVRFIAAVQKRFDKIVPLAALFAAPTIRQFSKLLEDAVEDSWKGTTGGFRGEGTGTPLFYIPGIAGYEFLPRGLEKHLAKQCRYYDGLQYPGFDGREPVPDRMEDIAAALASQIRRVWPQGPYCLAGWSFGGVMAFEVARQLEAQRLEVPCVYLLDSRVPGSEMRKRSATETIDVFGRHLSGLTTWQKAKFLKNLATNKAKFLWLRQAGSGISKVKEEESSLMHAMRQAARTQRPGSYGGRVVLFQMDEWEFYTGFRFALEQDFGWSKLTRAKLEIIQVPGNHISMLDEPAVSKIAEKIVEDLTQKASRQPSSV